MKKTLIIMVVITMIFIVTDFKNTQAADVPIKIGAIFSISGSNAFLGEPEKNTAEMAVAKINKQGGLLGRQIELIVMDDESDVNKTILAMDRLIRKDKVIAVLGPTGTGNALAVVHKMKNYGVPLISCAAAEKITTPTTPWVFKIAPSDRFAVIRILDHIQANQGKKIAVLTASDGFGQAGRTVLTELIPAKGLDLVADEVYGPKDSDMTPQLTKIASLNPDAIICWGTNPGPAVISRNRKQLGIEVPMYMSHGVASHKFIELAGDSSEGLLLPAGRLVVAEKLPADDQQRELLIEFKTGYEREFKSDVSTFAAHGIDAVMVTAKAIEMGQSDEPEKIRENLEKITALIGIYGIFNFSPENHDGLDERAFIMVRIHNNDWEIVQ